MKKDGLRLVAGCCLFFSLLAACVYLPTISAEPPLKEASYYEKLDKKIVQCHLCPRSCVIPQGKRGFCGVRENHDGTLYTLSYGRLVTITANDPIEKKPLFHFLPGTMTFSIATAGCNLKCSFCQNWEISQRCPDEIGYQYIEPAELVKKALESGRPTIAYTYTEPTIFYEYMYDCAKLARNAGLKNIMHSNGYIQEEPLRKLCKYLDGANIDLKGFTDDFYAKLSEGTVAPVLRSLKILKEEGVHLEITNLVLSGYNDDPVIIRKMCIWIKENLGADTPLHFSRAFPMYKLTSLNPTPAETLHKARQIAQECGLQYVYIGNLAGDPAENTLCPRCKKTVIERRGYFVIGSGLKDGACKFCGQKIEGVWK